MKRRKTTQETKRRIWRGGEEEERAAASGSAVDVGGPELEVSARKRRWYTEGIREW